MTKASFMKELESLLCNISSEERENALRYYEDYFADAGEEKEAAIIEELGSPKRVAKIILHELSSGTQSEESDEIYTENGYKNTKYGDDKYEVISPLKETNTDNEEIRLDFDTVEDTKKDNFNEYSSNKYTNDKRKESYQSGYGTNTNDNNKYSNYYNDPYYNGSTRKRENHNKKTNLWLLIILAIFAIPIGVPILIAVAAVLFSIGVTVLAVFFSIGILSVGLFLGGIVTVVAGIIVLFSVPINGIFVSGIGLILLGLGIVFSILSFQLIKAIVPRVIRVIVNILSRPFHRKSVIA